MNRHSNKIKLYKQLKTIHKNQYISMYWIKDNDTIINWNLFKFDTILVLLNLFSTTINTTKNKKSQKDDSK